MATRLRILVAAAVAALGFTGTASAAFAPRLVVVPSTHALGAGTQVKVSLAKASADDKSSGRVTIYAPVGYVAGLKQAPGATIGTAAVTMKAKAQGGKILAFAGAFTADTASKYDSNTCAPGAHEAVWLLALSHAQRTITLPVYVDTIKAGVEASFASAKIEFCLPAPDVPEAAGGAPFGAELFNATFVLRGVFTNPTAIGEYRWSAFFTPFFAGTAIPNLMATQEARALVRLPIRLTLAGAYLKQRMKAKKRIRKLRISGSLREGGLGVAGAAIQIYVGTAPQRLKLVRTVRTGPRGGYRFTVRLKKKTAYFRARVALGPRSYTATGCFGPSIAPGGCTAATLQPLAIATATLSTRVR